MSTSPRKMPRMPSYVVEESLGSVKIFWLDQKKLIHELTTVAIELAEADGNISKIVLFGSLGEGRATPGSDADILVLLKADNRPFIERISQWKRRFEIGFPVEVFPYTEEEPAPLVEEALKKGIILFER